MVFTSIRHLSIIQTNIFFHEIDIFQLEKLKLFSLMQQTDFHNKIINI